MSNARSPRDVCSTTIGTRGLIVLALFRFLGSNPAGAEPSAFSPSGWGESSNRLTAAWGVRRKRGGAAEEPFRLFWRRLFWPFSPLFWQRVFSPLSPLV